MSEEIKNNNEQPNNSTPEEKGGQGGEKLFTQEDVNRIVTERLARERAKDQPSAADQKGQELAQREAELECRDFLERENRIRGMNYPAADLVHLLGARPLPAFKDALHEFEKVIDKMSSKQQGSPEKKSNSDPRLRSAFGLK